MPKAMILALSAVAMLTAACNTVSGVGKDISAAGRAVSRTADDVKR